MLDIQNCKAGCLSDFKINHIFYVQAINQVEFFFVQIDQQFRVIFFRASISSESLEWSSLLLFTPILGSKPDEFIFLALTRSSVSDESKLKAQIWRVDLFIHICHSGLWPLLPSQPRSAI